MLSIATPDETRETFRINIELRGRRARLANELVATGLKRTEILGEGVELLHQKMVADELERKRLRAVAGSE